MVKVVAENGMVCYTTVRHGIKHGDKSGVPWYNGSKLIVGYARVVGVEISGKYGLHTVFGNKRIFGKNSYFFLN
jgi:hypothetical protein